MKILSISHSPRKSNIELLRMTSMFLVLLVHASYFSLGTPSAADLRNMPADTICRMSFESLSIVCVNLFIFISGWFGIHPRRKSIVNLLFQILFFSFLLYGGMLVAGKAAITFKGIAECFYATGKNWFVRAYLCLYILSPVLNYFVEKAPKKLFKTVLISFFIFQTLYGWLSNASDFFKFGYSTISFMGLYLLARYIGIYRPVFSTFNKRTDLLIFFVSMLFTLLLHLILALLNIVPESVYGSLVERIFAYNAPHVILSSLFLFLFFSKWEIKHNRWVNWSANSCFAVFLFHANPNILPYFCQTVNKLHAHYGLLEFHLLLLLFLVAVFIFAIFLDRIRIGAYKMVAGHLFPVME